MLLLVKDETIGMMVVPDGFRVEESTFSRGVLGRGHGIHIYLSFVLFHPVVVCLLYYLSHHLQGRVPDRDPA